MASYFQSFQRSLLIFHTLKLVVQGLYFTGMIIWLQYLFPLWEPQMLCYELNNFTQQALQDSQKATSGLVLNKYKLERWFYKSDWP